MPSRRTGVSYRHHLIIISALRPTSTGTFGKALFLLSPSFPTGRTVLQELCVPRIPAPTPMHRPESGEELGLTEAHLFLSGSQFPQLSGEEVGQRTL